jgi:nicotinamidase/pyrazinamidase
MARIIPKVAMLLYKKERQGAWLIFLADNHEPNDKEFKVWPPHCIKGSEESEIVDELRPFLRSKKAIHIPKTRYSGFFRTNLEETLERLKPERVIVVGTCTDICVLYTVAGLRMRDYKTLISRDCVETFNSEKHPAGEINRETLFHLKTILGVKVVEKARDI